MTGSVGIYCRQNLSPRVNGGATIHESRFTAHEVYYEIRSYEFSNKTSFGRD
jgi:hypothetical protein